PFATTSIPDCWKRYSGLYNGTSMNAADLTEYSGGWNFYQIAGSPFGTSPFINIWGNSYRYWLVSPLYTLPDAHNLNLIFDLALTKYNSPYNTPDMTGTDDKFIVFVSVDNGATWTDANSTVWSNNPANADSVYNNISPAGQKITIPLSAYSGNIQIAFYGETTMSNADNNLHIDNVAVREISSAKAITSFSLVEQTGAAVIDQDNYTVDIEVGYGTGLDALVPAIEVSQYATILPASGMVQDFSSPVTYTVTAEDGSYQAWTVTVTAASVPSTENDILTFSVPNQLGQSVIDNTNHTVSVTVPFNTTTTQLSALVPTFTVSPFATAVPGSGVAQDFNSTVSYEVTAQDGVNVETWTVTVTVEPVPSGAACSNPIAYTINAPRVSTLTNELSRQAWFAVTLDHDYHDVIWSTDGTAFDTKLFVVQSDCSQKPTQSSGNNSGDYLWYTDDGGTGTTTLASVISYLRRANVRNTAGLTGTYTGVFPAGTYYVVATPFDSYEAITNEVKLLVTGTLSVVPSVSTDSSSLVGETSARLHKTVTVSVPATYRPITSGGFRIRAVGDTYWDDIISASPYTSTSELVTGLTGGQTYEYYAFIQTGSGEDLVTYRGNTLTFTTDEPSIYPPTVVTDSVSSITQTSAQLYKTVTERTESITAEGFKWKQIGGGSESDSQDGALTGLSANTDYQFRAYATTETGTVYGDVLTFSTLAHVAPTVVTDAATSITQTSAQLNKTVTQGSEVITAEGYKWKQAASGEAEADSQDGTLTNLSAGTEYQFRAYATTASGTVYGSTLTFTALAHVAPTVLTLDATSVDKTTAQLNSTVTAGTEPIDEQGYWYRAVGGEYVKSLDGALTGLTENTDYEFYAYATTASGTVRDEEHIKTFKTLQTGLTLINDNLVTIYPNPANYIATMAIEGLYGDAQVTVTDIAGKTVANLNISAGTNLLQINVSNFTEGTYLVKVVSDNINTIKKLVVKR
ncbi:MAG: DUF5018 domain-containing protein, partial [Prevotellaceae bacterium]|nr:DUF5018 domain-containing protein [Prevotellaceae bacterium]